MQQAGFRAVFAVSGRHAFLLGQQLANKKPAEEKILAGHSSPAF
jgi:hypothetical protein